MTVTIEKLVFGGQGLARMNGKVVFVWNALPGETVEIEIIQKKKTHLEAVATKILTPSLDRISAQENHFLSCSPWQIISWEKENEWKKDIAKETYEKLGGLTLSTLNIKNAEPITQYRNKMEYSFAQTESGEITFAFFERGGRHRYSIPSCILADKQITAVADTILTWINQKKIPIRSLKTLVIRCNTKGEVIAGLFLKDRLHFDSYPELKGSLIGFHVYYSTHHSPASVPTESMESFGSSTLTEVLMGKTLSYGLFSFFQIHLPIFTQALTDIAAFIEPNTPLLDFYSGVGSIGIPLSSAAKTTTLVDSNTEAIEYAQKNILDNALTGFDAMATPAEKMTDLITPECTLILDPPRAGLHQKVVHAIIEQKPRRVIYLSCNLATHARDIDLLLTAYRLVHLNTYNFFPKTPHIEGLAILDATT